MKVEWTKEMVDTLVAKTSQTGDEYISYADIAINMTAIFGVPFTKNSLIGKARRLNIPIRVSGRVRVFKEDVKRKRKRVKMIKKVVHVSAPIDPKLPRPKKGEAITIYQLRDNTCKWPFGHRPPYVYCGKPTIDFTSWCAGHCQVVFTSGSAKISQK